MRPILELARDLAQSRTTSRALVEAALARIEDKSGEGGRAFIAVYRDRALAEANASDRLRQHGLVPSPLAGLPVSIKDLLDVKGETTRAGSVVLADAPPATADAPVVARLRAAGAILVGRTNMTEFAYSGIGYNPHYGTPKNPWDRQTGRIPGGSSSGAAISVTDGMAAAAIGSDTGGSIRIPAALCGLAGFKPTARRVPLEGAFPLSFSLDSLGPLAPTLSCCAVVDAVLAGEAPSVPDALPIEGLRFAVPTRLVLDNLDDTVASAFERSLKTLEKAGALLSRIAFAELDEYPLINAKGGFGAPEAFAHHRRLIETKGDRFDPMVVSRIKRGAEMSAADYVDLIKARADFIRRSARVTESFDAVLMPTCPIVAPSLAEIATPQGFMAKNVLLLRNTSIGNFLDRSALTLPIHEPGTAPVGLMLMGETMGDRRLIQVGLAVEAALKG
ncbi:MAG: amidase [Proteobacteria bacterium]|nr:amidase [Pseudomonadota bacterium]MBI3499337.1 amidase [Pseudomonadota bacterium]